MGSSQHAPSRKVAFLIPYSPALHHRQNAIRQFQTCFASLPSDVDVFYLAARDSQVPAELVDVTIRAGLREGYFQVLNKTQLALQTIERFGGYDFVVRGNSSNYFQVSEIRGFFSKLNPEVDFYGGKLSNVSEEMTPLEYPVVYAGGSGIYLSRKSYRRLLNLDVSRYHGVVDDVAIGDFMLSESVPLVDIYRNDITDYHLFRRSLQSRLKSWESNVRTLRRFDWVHRISSAECAWENAALTFGFFWSEVFFLARKKKLEAVLKLLARGAVSLYRFKQRSLVRT